MAERKRTLDVVDRLLAEASGRPPRAPRRTKRATEVLPPGASASPGVSRPPRALVPPPPVFLERVAELERKVLQGGEGALVALESLETLADYAPTAREALHRVRMSPGAGPRTVRDQLEQARREIDLREAELAALESARGERARAESARGSAEFYPSTMRAIEQARAFAPGGPSVASARAPTSARSLRVQPRLAYAPPSPPSSARYTSPIRSPSFVPERPSAPTTSRAPATERSAPSAPTTARSARYVPPPPPTPRPRVPSTSARRPSGPPRGHRQRQDTARRTGRYHDTVKACARRLVEDAVHEYGGNKTRAAAELGLTRRALHKVLARSRA